MPPLTIRPAVSADRSAWDEFVLNHPDATPYHLFAWKLAVENAYKHKGYYLLAEEDGKLRGVLPLIHMKLPFLQNQLVSLPFCDLAGPLADDPIAENRLLVEATQLGSKFGCKNIEIRTRIKQKYSVLTEPAAVNSAVNKVSMLLSLPSTPEKLWNGFKSKLRSQVRKAEKNGLSFRFGKGTKDLDAFYRVFSKNMHELGSPVHAKKFIAAVLANFQKHCRMGLVFKEDLPLGCGIILFYGKTISIPWASTLREFNRLSPNMLLYWNFLHFAADNGFTLFDFGRSTPEEGTYKFKAQWGAAPVPLSWRNLLETENKKQTSNQDTSESTNRTTPTPPVAREFVERIWQKFPFWLANNIGPVLRKHISL